MPTSISDRESVGLKTKEIAKQYGLNGAAFDKWIKESGYQHRFNSFTGNVDLGEGYDVADIVNRFRQAEAERQVAAELAAEEQRAAEIVKQQALSRMLITSGFSFDGYTITKYSGYISGDDAVQIPRGGGMWQAATDVGSALMESLVHIRRNALSELKEAAHALGCNAVIGVDFDYLTLDPETVHSGGGTLYLPYVFGVTANGNAVVIEKTGGVVPPTAEQLPPPPPGYSGLPPSGQVWP